MYEAYEDEIFGGYVYACDFCEYEDFEEYVKKHERVIHHK